MIFSGRYVTMQGHICSRRDLFSIYWVSAYNFIYQKYAALLFYKYAFMRMYTCMNVCVPLCVCVCVRLYIQIFYINKYTHTRPLSLSCTYTGIHTCNIITQRCTTEHGNLAQHVIIYPCNSQWFYKLSSHGSSLQTTITLILNTLKTSRNQNDVFLHLYCIIFLLSWQMLEPQSWMTVYICLCMYMNIFTIYSYTSDSSELQ